MVNINLDLYEFLKEVETQLFYDSKEVIAIAFINFGGNVKCSFA